MATLFQMEPLEDPGLKLNEAQQRAITHGEGPLLVIAGAGTGKTRVITERIRQLLHSNPELTGENILALTFTKKAAGEMKARVVKATGERGKAVTVATFHSFCETLLKDCDPQRVVLDTVDHWILLRRNLARLKLEQYRRIAEPGQFLSDFVEFFSRCQDELVSAEDYQRYADRFARELQEERAFLDADTLAEREEMVAREQEIARAYRASQELLQEKKRLSDRKSTRLNSSRPSISYAVFCLKKKKQWISTPLLSRHLVYPQKRIILASYPISTHLLHKR